MTTVFVILVLIVGFLVAVGLFLLNDWLRDRHPKGVFEHRFSTFEVIGVTIVWAIQDVVVTALTK